MENVQNTAWGFQSDNDESLKSKSGGKFGLNSATITKFEFNPNAGKDGAPSNAIDMTIMIGDREYRNRVYDITGDLYSGNESVSPGEPGYAEAFAAEQKQKTAVVVHGLKALGVTDAQIMERLKAAQPTDFATWAQAVCSTLPANFATLPVDVFLEYQWNIGEGNDRTYLQLPKNMKGGRFLSPAVACVGEWTETVDSKGLRYIDKANTEHPFTRGKNYMESNKAIQQIEGEEAVPAVSAGGDTGTATAGKW